MREKRRDITEISRREEGREKMHISVGGKRT